MAQHPPLSKTFVIANENEDPGYPILGLRKDPTSGGYRKPVAGHAHPDTTKYPNHIFTGVEPSETDKSVVWIYRRVPGPTITGKSFDDISLSTEKTTVAHGTAPDQGFEVAGSIIVPQDGVIATRQTDRPLKRSGSELVSGWPKGYQKSKGQEDLTPQKFRGQVVIESTTEQKSLADPDVLPDPVAVIGVDDVSKATTTKINEYRYEETTTTEVIDENADPLPGQYTDEQGVVSTAESLVDDGTVVTESAIVKSDRIVPLGNGKSIRFKETYASPFPEFTDRETDEISGVVSTVKRKIIESVAVNPTGHAAEVAAYVAAGYTVNTKAYDTVRAWMRGIKTFSVPDPIVLYGSESIPLPRVLESVEWIVSQSSSATASDAASISADVDFELLMKFRSGPTGKLKTRRTLTYSITNPGDFSSSKAWHTVTGRVVIKWEWSYNGGSSAKAVSKMNAQVIPECLHDGLRIPNPPQPEYGIVTTRGDLPRSSLPWQYNSWFHDSTDVRQLRRDLFVKEKLEVFIPNADGGTSSLLPGSIGGPGDRVGPTINGVVHPPGGIWAQIVQGYEMFWLPSQGRYYERNSWATFARPHAQYQQWRALINAWLASHSWSIRIG